MTAVINQLARRASPVRITPHTEDYGDDILALSAGSQSLEDLSYTVHPSCVEIVIFNHEDALQSIRRDGSDAAAPTAGSGNFPIIDNMLFGIEGVPLQFAKLRLYSTSGGNIGIYQKILTQV